MKYLIIILLLCFWACRERRAKLDVPSFQVMSDLKKRKLSDYIDFVQYVPFETTDSSLVGSISRVVVTNSRIFVGDRIANGILVFDRQGRFLNKINHQGRGPEEYSRLYDFDVVEKDSLVYFFVGGKFQVYGYNGEYRHTVLIQNNQLIPRMIAVSSNEIYLYMNYSACEEAQAYNTIFIDKQGYAEQSMSPYSNKIAGHISYSPRLYFRYYNNTLVYFNNFENIIYERGNGNSRPIFLLDFSQYELPEIDEENVMSLQENRFRDYALLYNIALVNNKYYALFMINEKRYMSVISLSDCSVSTVNLSDDLEYDISLTNHFLDYVCVADNCFVTYYDWSDTPELFSKLNISEDNNPVVVFYHVKE